MKTMKKLSKIFNGVQKLKIHFIGIGGIGVSALARYYLEKGYQVSGSDLASSEITNALIKKGAKLLFGEHKEENLPKNANLVIYSPAVSKNNPELLQAEKHKLKTQSYPEALGELTKKYFTIAVSGTHGKSTTSSMIGLLLVKAGFDPTIIVGTKLKEFGNSNCRVGKSKYLVIEADEHMASFLNYWPKIIVLTNIEKEHLDYYKNLSNVLKTYKKYIGHLSKEGILVINNDDKNIRKIIRNRISKRNPIPRYSLKQPEAGRLKKTLKIPGVHNVSNALGALAVARILKIPDKISFKALSEYKGSWRRFEERQLTINNKQLTIISDYGHHPTEIKATLEAARAKYPKKRIRLLYQPHQYQRTFYLFNDFVKVFKRAPIDEIIITDIFDVAGRESEKIRQKVSSEKLAKAVDKDSVIYLPKAKILHHFLKKNLRAGEVIMIMGAGDIYKLSEDF